MMQVVDIRVGNGRHHFVDAHAEREHQAKLTAFRDALPKSVRFAVAPGHQVTGRGGRVFGPGDAIAQADVDADSGWPEQGRPAWRVFADKVFDGAILENYGWEPTKEDDAASSATHVRIALR